MTGILRQFSIASVMIGMIVSPILAGQGANCACQQDAKSCCRSQAVGSCCSSAKSCCSEIRYTVAGSSCCGSQANSASGCADCQTCQEQTAPLTHQDYFSTSKVSYDLLITSAELPSVDQLPEFQSLAELSDENPPAERPARVLFSVWLN